MDIREGDYLTVSGTDYPIKSVAEWNSHPFGDSPSFARLATISCSTKRAPAGSGGKWGARAENLTGLYCTPLDPVDPDLRERLGIQTPHELIQTMISDSSDFVHLVLEDLKTP